MWQILLTILIVLTGAVLMLGGFIISVWLVVHVLAPMTEPKQPEKPPPPRSAVEPKI